MVLERKVKFRHLSRVFDVLACSCACVLTCWTCLHAYVLGVALRLRAYMFTSLVCLRVSRARVLTCLEARHACVLRYLRIWRACGLTCLRVRVFSMRACFMSLRAHMSYILFCSNILCAYVLVCLLSLFVLIILHLKS